MSQTLFNFQLEFPGYWHAGTGQAGAGDVDAVVLRDPRGLPYFPGKALKGLFSEACCALVADGVMPDAELLALFGREGGDSRRSVAKLRFANAGLPEPEATALAHPDNRFQDGLFEVLASTALEESGLARKRTLRRIEVAIPMTLDFTVACNPETGGAGPDAEQVEKLLREAAGRIIMAGAHRHAGLGECRVHFRGRQVAAPPAESPANSLPSESEGDLLRLPFEIEMLEDVILGENAATTGAHRCLDHLTGAALLGAFAADHYRSIADLGGDGAFQVFHAGAVRFGCAHPLDAAGLPALPLPLSWHHKKNDSLFEEETSSLRASALVDLSVQKREPSIPYEQARGQWIGSDARQVSVDYRRMLKSARDTMSFGRPSESQLFGYQALAAGQRFGGEIWVRTDLVPAEAVELLRTWLASAPEVTFGRSRSAEFGTCRLSPGKSGPPAGESAAQPASLRLYALSDLCLDGAEALPADGAAWHAALAGWHIDLERTHARFRTYAHWNGHRGCPDPARQVITRGSVVTFVPDDEHRTFPTDLQRQIDLDGIGTGLHQGLGRVLVNPVFPAAAVAIRATSASGRLPSPPACDTLLFRVARRRSRARQGELNIDALAKEWVAQWKRYEKQPSPSQWSRIRQMAAGNSSIADFGKKLAELLDHGAARRAWNGAKKGSETLAQLLTGLATDRKNWPDEAKTIETRVGKEAAERLLLAAIAEAARQLRQPSKK